MPDLIDKCLQHLFLLESFSHVLCAFTMSPQSDHRLQLALADVAVEESLLLSLLVLHPTPFNAIYEIYFHLPSNGRIEHSTKTVHEGFH